MRLSELPLAEIRAGYVLLIPCQGKEPCDGLIRVPFTPPLFERDSSGDDKTLWHRTGGSTLNDITLKESVNAEECGHFHVIGGEIKHCE